VRNIPQGGSTMSSSLENWPRPYYVSGGGDAFLLYVVYGPVPQDSSIPAGKYRCDGIPSHIQISSYGPTTDPETVNTFRSGYLWDQFERTNSRLASDVANQSQCQIIQGTVPDPGDLNYLRNVIGFIAWCLDSGGVAVFDPQMFKWWTPAEWRKWLFEPAAAVPTSHIMILTSEDEDGTEWFHTRGMRKFGRPDLSIHGVSADLRAAIIDLFNRFIEFQAFGGLIPDGQEIRMRSLPPGMICTHQGDLEDPDFNNTHIEINW
jgi:hypothetical protein